MDGQERYFQEKAIEFKIENVQLKDEIEQLKENNRSLTACYAGMEKILSAKNAEILRLETEVQLLREENGKLLFEKVALRKSQENTIYQLRQQNAEYQREISRLKDCLKPKFMDTDNRNRFYGG